MATSRPSSSRNYETGSQALSLITAIAILGLLVAGVTLVKRSFKSMGPAGSSPGKITQPYSDGAYEATATYGTPAGVQPLKVKITLTGGRIANATTTPGAESAASKQYEAAFMRGYKQLVVGRSISGLSLSRVSGASLTSKGFNRALDQIRSQAHAKL